MSGGAEDEAGSPYSVKQSALPPRGEDTTRLRRILVVDDDELTSQMYLNELGKFGYDVTTASSGKDGIELMLHSLFDLAFIELRLPDVSGLEVIEAIKGTGTVPIMTSADYSAETARAAISNGAYCYLVKPIPFWSLGSIIRAAWNRLGNEAVRLHSTAGPDGPMASAPPATLDPWTASCTVKLDIQEHDMKEVMDHVHAVCKPDLEEKGITLKLLVSERLPKMKADRGMILCVIRNLLANAISHSPRNGTVTVGSWLEGESVLVLVKDGGDGMSQDELKRIFTRIQPADAPLDLKARSSRLSVCRDLVEAHGGRIWAESEVGRGSTFYFTLPT